MKTRAERIVELMRIVDVLDLDELKQVSRVVRLRWDILERESREAVKVGDRVTFEMRRRGYTDVYRGTVESFNPKRIIVRLADGRRARVSPTLLKKEGVR